jgi:hypothetical protein
MGGNTKWKEAWCSMVPDCNTPMPGSNPGPPQTTTKLLGRWPPVTGQYRGLASEGGGRGTKNKLNPQNVQEKNNLEERCGGSLPVVDHGDAHVGVVEVQVVRHGPHHDQSDGQVYHLRTTSISSCKKFSESMKPGNVQ